MILKDSPGTSLAIGFGVGVVTAVLLRKSPFFVNSLKAAGTQVSF